MPQQDEEPRETSPKPALHGFPVPKYDVLMVFLTHLNDDEKNKLVLHYQKALPDSATIRTWCPSNRTLKSIAHQDAHRDSQANIYGIAILAYRAGWSSFVVADEMTKRQLSGRLRVGERSIISIVMVTVTLRRPKGVHVFAKRTKGDEGKLLEALRSMDWRISFARDDSTNALSLNLLYEEGLLLHDPDKPLFFVDDAMNLGRETFVGAIEAALIIESRLPQELIDYIISIAEYENSRDSLLMLPSWIYDEAGPKIVGLKRTTDDEVRMAESAIQDFFHFNQKKNNSALSQKPFRFVPWERTCPASRRDVMNMWTQYNDHRTTRPPFLCFIVEPFEDERYGPFTIAYLDEARSTTFMPSALIQLVSGKIPLEDSPETRIFLRDIMEKALGSGERLYHPDQPFYASPPAWLSADGRITAVPVFYLTNKLTKEEDEALKAEIDTVTNLNGLNSSGTTENPCCFVPWKTGKDDEADGTFEDMWEIFWTVYTYNHGADDTTPVFFIDRQSGSDLKTIVADSIHYFGESADNLPEVLGDVPYPSLKGFRHGRVPGRDAQMIHAYMYCDNMRLDEFMDMYGGEEQIFLRPGWPGHEVLSDEADD